MAEKKKTPEEKAVGDTWVKMMVARTEHGAALAKLAEVESRGGKHEEAGDLYMAAGRADPSIGHNYYEHALEQYKKSGSTQKADLAQAQVDRRKKIIEDVIRKMDAESTERGERLQRA